MNPFTYVKTHWHAMALGAIVWHFAGPYLMSQVGGLSAGTKAQ